MATKPVPHVELQQAVNALSKYGSTTAAALALDIPRQTLTSRLDIAKRAGMRPSTEPPVEDVDSVKLQLRRVETELRAAREDNLDVQSVRRAIAGLAEDASQTPTPEWVTTPPNQGTSPGVPTLFASDWHFGEVVDPTQIGGVNAYNMEIAKDRAKRMVDTAIDLLNNHIVNPNYPGIVFALGGDMVSGDIHEELVATNEKEIMPVVVALFGVLCWCIETLANAFGKVFLPCVGGNHGRNTHKIRAKGRNFTSFDWLVYTFLSARFAGDARVTFYIPNGPDALYECAGRKYLLTHGDSYRGGDGLIGCLGPIIRGDHKKRSRNAQIDMEYDTQLMGHFHQLIQLERVIVNGSLKGYDEYASSANFGFEPPRQALWITHPTHGITFSMPVNVDPPRPAIPRAPEWVSWLK